MKNLLRIITCLLLFTLATPFLPDVGNAAFAQAVQPVKLGSDTITDTGSETVTFNAIPEGVSVTIQAVVTKLSGTVAGTVVLQGSVDGTNWYSASTDTLTNTNVTTNTYGWTLSKDVIPGVKLRLLAKGSGTMSATIKGYIVYRKT